MNALSLAPELTPEVQKGRKVQTIRRGIRGYTLGPATFDDGGIKTPIFIWSVQVAYLETLTEEDALESGHVSLEACIEELYRYYPDLCPLEELTLVKFEVRS